MKNLSQKSILNSLSIFKAFEINKLQQHALKGGNGSSDDTSDENSGAIIVTVDIVHGD